MLSWQGATAQRFYHGFHAGVHGSTAFYKDTAGVKKDTKFKYGVNAGYMGRVFVDYGLYFTPEIMYSYKGFEVASPSSLLAKQEIRTHYIEIKALAELMFKRKYFIKFGPSIGVAVTGTNNELSTTNLRKKENQRFNFSEWSRFDFGATINVGMHLDKGYVISINTNTGISNLWDGDLGPNVKNSVYGVSVGKYLSWNRKKAE
jgi:hypothetical protein